MKKLLTICAVMTLILAFSEPAGAGLSWSTAGTGATATYVGPYVELFTQDGGNGSAYVRLNIAGGIALNGINTLSYVAKIVSFDDGPYFSGTPAPEVVLNIDADGDGLEGTGLAWMTPPMHQPAELGDDNFLSGDYWPFVTTPDTDFVNRDALGAVYYYWSANDTKDDFGSFWNPFATVLGLLPRHDIDLTDKVYSIDFIVGTSSNWINCTVQFLSVELNGIIYVAPSLGNCISTLVNENCTPGRGMNECVQEQIGECHEMFGIPSAHTE